MKLSALNYNTIDLIEPTTESTDYFISRDMESIFIDKLKLMNQDIQERYLKPSKDVKGVKNLIIDSYLTKELTNKLFNFTANLNEFPNSSYVISRMFSKVFNIPYIPLQDLFLMVGYNYKDLKKILLEVKKKHINLCMIGVGGFGHNFIYLLSQLALELNISNIFSKMILSDEDSVEYSNIFRFMSDYVLNYTHNNINYYTNEVLNTCIYLFLPFKLNLIQKDNIKNLSTKKIKYYFGKIDYRNIYNIKDVNSYLFLGAPTIETRELLFQEGFDFLCPLHHNDSMYLWTTPKVTPEIQFESYGRIDLNQFFLNMVKMTAEILKAIVNDEFKNRDKLITSFSIKDIDTSKTSRKYNIKFYNERMNNV